MPGQPDPDRLTILAQYGRGQSRLLAKLVGLRDAVDAFCAAQGDRASVDVIKRTLADAIARVEAAQRMRPIDRATFRSTADAVDALAAVFEPAIADDIEAELSEGAGGPPAARLSQAYRSAADARERLIALNDSIGDNFQDGETEMPQDSQIRATGRSGPGTTSYASGRVSVSHASVTDQLAATLDQLGLPHEGGRLDLEGGDANMAERLVRALESNFEVTSSSIGMRARRRRGSGGWTGSVRPTSELAGRMAIDAQAITLDCDALELVLDGVESHFRFELGSGRDATRRAREAIREQLREIKVLAARPTGIPLDQANARIDQLGSRVNEFFASLDMPNYLVFDLSADGDEIPDVEEFKVPPTVAQGERLRAQAEEAHNCVEQIETRIVAILGERTRGETTYRLERAMEACGRGVTEAQMRLQSVAMLGALDRWQAIDLIDTDDATCSAENLADGLEGALAWLKPHTDRFASPSFFANDMTSTDAKYLGQELSKIGAILGDCASRIKDFEPGGNAQFVRLIDDLAALTKKAGDLANDLAQPAARSPLYAHRVRRRTRQQPTQTVDLA